MFSQFLSQRVSCLGLVSALLLPFLILGLPSQLVNAQSDKLAQQDTIDAGIDIDIDIDGQLKTIQSQGLWHPDSQTKIVELFEANALLQLEKALKRASRKDDDAQALANYGNFLIASSFFEKDENKQTKAITEAYELLEDALKVDQQNWDARMGYATLMLYSVPYYGYASFAEDTMLALIEDQEKQPAQLQFVQAYLQFGEYYQGQDNTKAAQEIFQRGLKHFPGNQDLLNANQQIAMH